MDKSVDITITTEIQQLISINLAWNYHVIPCEETGNVIKLYIGKGQADYSLQNELGMLLGKNIQFVEVDSALISKALGKYYRKSASDNNMSNRIGVNFQNENFLQQLIEEAYGIGCSDIHFEVFEGKCRVRMRIDGKLLERYIIKKEEYPVLINKIKIKANLDISEKRLPQDGRIMFSGSSSKFDIRVSVLPSLYGEKIVLRLLNKDGTDINIEHLGFSENQLSDYLEYIKKTNGIILISGPTGSGKTTTLYATLKILNKEESNILTIEDPIEYTLEGVTQVQLKESIGLTFASALRTFLRQDPDIIMLGEIRDGETAQMAVRSALTGHLVLSTIHTNSAWGTVSRLIDMGVPSYLIANTLNMTIAQRLVRLLCPHCKKEVALYSNQLPHKYVPKQKIDKQYVPIGCEKCYFTGYKGRKAIYEIIPIDRDFSEAIKNNVSNISSLIKRKKIKLLSETAFELFATGETSIEEIYPLLIDSI